MLAKIVVSAIAVIASGIVWALALPIIVMFFNYALRAIWQAGLIDMTWVGRAIGAGQ